MKLYQTIYHRLIAIENSSKKGYADWQGIHTQALNDILKQLPHGSGIDSTYTLDLTADNKGFVLRFEYHHMNEHGGYCGWSKYSMYVRPDFIGGFELTVLGSNKNGTKDYLMDTFYSSLSNDVE